MHPLALLSCLLVAACCVVATSAFASTALVQVQRFHTAGCTGPAQGANFTTGPGGCSGFKSRSQTWYCSEDGAQIFEYAYHSTDCSGEPVSIEQLNDQCYFIFGTASELFTCVQPEIGPSPPSSVFPPAGWVEHGQYDGETCSGIATADAWPQASCVPGQGEFICSSDLGSVFEVIQNGSQTCEGPVTSVVVWNATIQCDADKRFFSCVPSSTPPPSLPSGLPTTGFNIFYDTQGACTDGDVPTITLLQELDVCAHAFVGPLGLRYAKLEILSDGSYSLSLWTHDATCSTAPPLATITGAEGACVQVETGVLNLDRPVAIAFLSEYQYPTGSKEHRSSTQILLIEE